METPFEIDYVFRFIPKLLTTLGTTLTIVGGALLLGLIVGLLVALPRLYRVPAIQRVSQLYVSFFRGTPVLIQLFLIYYGLPEILKLFGADVSKTPVLVFVILTYGLHTAAYVSEIIRGAVSSVDRGQVEAAYAVGMTGRQAFIRIVLPQALAIAVPVFTNQLLALLKDTSLAFTLGVMELTGKASSLTALTQRFIESYLSLALVYLAISLVLEKSLKAFERKLLKHDLPAAEVRKLPGRRNWASWLWRDAGARFPLAGKETGRHEA